MAEVGIKLLGQFEIWRDGAPIKLPPSKKTRALLAYLVLEQTPASRERLCELFWDIPDDPRGSLRWSLSKLRGILNRPGAQALHSDRKSVWLDASLLDVDALTVLDLVEKIPATSNGNLVQLAHYYRGHLLEGLDLPKLQDYNLWCIAQRELLLQQQCKLLRAILARFGDDPGQALAHAKSLVSLAPYEEADRAELIRILVNLHRHEEADQQLRIGQRMLDEIGQVTTGALVNARRGKLALPSALKQSPSRNGQRSFIGRETDLDNLLTAHNDMCESGRARFFLITGDPGIGKTALLEAFTHRLDAGDTTILQAAGYEVESLRPFGLWQDTFGEAFEHIEFDHRERLFDALANRVSKQVQNRPLILIFDDIHWSDDSSLAALHYIARVHVDHPLLIILSARTEDARDHGGIQKLTRSLQRMPHFQELQLQRLTADVIGEIIKAEAPDADVAAISEESQGLPLMAIELARAQANGGDIHSLKHITRDRMSHIGLEGVELLQWASVVVPRIEVRFLSELSGLATKLVEESLTHAEQLLLIQTTPTGHKFSHDLVARSIYADISPARRRVMHARVASALESSLDPDQAGDLAHHAAQSGDASLAARAMVAAARTCLRFFANEEATSLASRGEHFLAELPDQEACRLAIELADVRYASEPLDDWQSAADKYVHLAETALDHGALEHARLGYQMASHVRWSHGHWSGAREESLQAERISRGASEEEQVIGMAEAARCLAMVERDLEHAGVLLVQAQSMAKRHRVVHRALPAAIGMLEFHEGRLAAAAEAFKDARVLCRAIGDRIDEFQANEYLFMIDYLRGDQEQYPRHAQQMLEIGKKIREGSEGPFAQCIVGLLKLKNGDEQHNLAELVEALRIVDAKHRLSYVLNRWADYALDDDPQQCMLLAREARDCARILDRPTEWVFSSVLIARALMARCDTASARAELSDIEEASLPQAAAWAQQAYQTCLEGLSLPG